MPTGHLQAEPFISPAWRPARRSPPARPPPTGRPRQDRILASAPGAAVAGNRLSRPGAAYFVRERQVPVLDLVLQIRPAGPPRRRRIGPRLTPAPSVFCRSCTSARTAPISPPLQQEKAARLGTVTTAWRHIGISAVQSLRLRAGDPQAGEGVFLGFHCPRLPEPPRQPVLASGVSYGRQGEQGPRGARRTRSLRPASDR